MTWRRFRGGSKPLLGVYVFGFGAWVKGLHGLLNPTHQTRFGFGKETRLRADFEAAVSYDEFDKLGSIYRILKVRPLH